MKIKFIFYNTYSQFAQEFCNKGGPAYKKKYMRRGRWMRRVEILTQKNGAAHPVWFDFEIGI